MAYRFKLSEPFEHGVHRIARQQFDRAQRHLKNADPAAAVHETRKCLKRLRALCRLIRPALKPADYRATNNQLRDIARELSASRDAHVMRVTLGKLQARADAAEAKVLAKLAAKLPPADAAGPEDGQDRGQQTSPDPRGRAAARLKEATRNFRALRLQRTGIAIVAAGFEKSYAQGRRRYRDLRYRGAADSLSHEWRKSVQAHWRHLALLAPGWPDFFAARIASARIISEALGDEHDLEVLEKFAAAQMGKADAARLLTLTGARKLDLRQQAYAEAARLYADKPRDLAKRVSHYWLAAAQSAHGQDQDRTSDRAASAQDVAPPQRETAKPPAAKKLNRPAPRRQRSQSAGKNQSPPAGANGKQPAPAAWRAASK